MASPRTAFRPEEQPLTLGVEFLHEIDEHDDLGSPSSAGTAVGSAASSIKFTRSPSSSPGPAPNRARTPLPMAKFSILLMLNAVCPLAFELIYPFINAMVVEIGVTDDPERVGFYSGLVESVFSLMGFVMILPCGYLSDTFGRKPVIITGFAGLAVSMAAFGLSKSLMGMILSRCIGGALGASWAAIKVMTGEMTDRSNQDVAFASLHITYRAGQIIGLPLGGLLAHPEQRFALFRTPFWAEYPYLLPCLVGAAFAMASVIPAAIFIEETLPSKCKQRRKLAKRATSYGSTSTSASSTSTLVASQESLLYAPESTDIEDAQKTKKQSSWSSVMTPSIISLLFNNAMMCLTSEMIFSIYPLFAYTPIASGGLGMSEAEIGTQMAIRSFIHIGIMLAFNQVVGRVKTMDIYKFVMSLWPVVVLCFPLLNWIVRTQPGGNEGVLFMASQILVYIVWSLCGICWVCSGSLVNDASPSAEALGLMTGIAQMSTILPQAISPALGNSLFAASVHRNILGGNLIWLVLLVLSVSAWVHSLTLKAATYDWRETIDHDDD
ncbi:MFS general substrate transporter [Ceratobasidium sp. AG-I]|nr:MFS general substrate transporter [Ceratobasidium sp. AG-I]